MENELWKPVPIAGIEDYEVSNLGRIRSNCYRNKAECVVLNIKPRKKDGYVPVQLRRKQYLVHKLVALAFVPNERPGVANEVDHMDCNRSNNVASNLCWATKSENMKRSYREGTNHNTYVPPALRGDASPHTKFTDAMATEAYKIHVNDRVSIPKLALRYGVNRGTINRKFRLMKFPTS